MAPPPSDREERAAPEGELATAGEQAGFTLLEVLVAVAILAMSLSSLLGSQMDAMRATRYARGITAAGFLAEYQIVQLEYQMRKDGWVQSDVEVTGDFAEQGWPEIEYQCLVDFIELPEYSELQQAKSNSEHAAEAQSDSFADANTAGDQAFGMLGVVWPIIKAAIENAIRRANCTVYWTDGRIEHEFTVYTFWTDMNALNSLPGLGGEFSDADDPSGGGNPQSQGGAGGSGSSGPTTNVPGPSGGGGAMRGG